MEGLYLNSTICVITDVIVLFVSVSVSVLGLMLVLVSFEASVSILSPLADGSCFLLGGFFAKQKRLHRIPRRKFLCARRTKLSFVS